jgi:hypothetical protein
MIYIYGYSDDLIEIEGDQQEELDAYDNALTHLKLSDGSILEVEFDSNGFWKISKLMGEAQVTIVPARGENAGNDEHDCPSYSDKAIISENISVVSFSSLGRINRIKARKTKN